MEKLLDQHKWQETKTDRERQFQILRAFCGAKKCCGITMPDGHPFDAIITRYPKTLAYAEIKYRNTPLGRYADYTIDLLKLEAIWKLAEPKKLKTLLIVSWCGEIRYATVQKEAGYPVSNQKRRDRDELADRVIHIPLSLFRAI